MKPRVFANAALIACFVFMIGCDPSAPNDEKVIANKEPGIAPPEEAAAVPKGPASEALEDYALIAPLRSTETYLLNGDKEVVHRWKAELPPTGGVYLMENGDLLRGVRDPEFNHFSGGGIGLAVERYSWEGELLWRFRYADEDHCSHHDIEPMPNGNLLMIAWERKTKEEAVAQGRDPKLLQDDLWPDHVIEVQPEGATWGKIVWEWHMWDHLVQDFEEFAPEIDRIGCLLERDLSHWKHLPAAVA